MYQIKFNSTTYPLDLEKVRVSRKVYHVPQRSNFVFMQQIQAIKGSDASNMNDEEPADHELEFSDDEAEAEHRSATRRRRIFAVRANGEAEYDLPEDGSDSSKPRGHVSQLLVGRVLVDSRRIPLALTLDSRRDMAPNGWSFGLNA